MAWHDLLARKFVLALESEDAELGDVTPYKNRYGRVGLRYSLIVNNRTFHVSTSPVGRRFPPKQVARVIADCTNLDRKRRSIYHNSDGEPGLCVEARWCGFWFEVWTPTVGQPMDDYFANFISEKENSKFQ